MRFFLSPPVSPRNQQRLPKSGKLTKKESKIRQLCQLASQEKMCDNGFMQTKPQITEEKIEEINALIQKNPDWHRSRLSKELCLLWDWHGPNGQMKDISCRDMLRELDRIKKISLPPARNRSRQISGPETVIPMKHDTTPVNLKLGDIAPVSVEIVTSGDGLMEFKSYIGQYHYLGFDRSIGENMKYMFRGGNGRPLACMLFGSAAWACRPRDEYIGWGSELRKANLQFVTNNSRFLIFPWITVPHLASHALSLAARRIACDWREKYGHPLVLLETFVEQGRFKGTCYKAANWQFVGGTTGRGRNSVHSYAVLPKKDVYLYPLAADFRQTLTGLGREGATNGF
jgi:hypothetical protein